MFYYFVGLETQGKSVRKIIEKTETEIQGKTPMDEAEAVALLEQYEKEDAVKQLKKNLSDTDYIACKIAEGSATTADYAEAIAQRQGWREEINRLESTNV